MEKKKSPKMKVKKIKKQAQRMLLLSAVLKKLLVSQKLLKWLEFQIPLL